MSEQINIEALYERVGRVLKDPDAMPLLSRELAEIRRLIREHKIMAETLESILNPEPTSIDSDSTFIGCAIYLKNNYEIKASAALTAIGRTNY